jgi:hypothetical protein
MRIRRIKERRQRVDRGVDKGGEEEGGERGDVGEPRLPPRVRRRSPTSALTSARLMLYLNLKDGELEHAAIGEEEVVEEENR